MKGNSIMNNRNTILTTILLVLGCLAVSAVTQAKQPSEDRGNGNSAAEDVDALNLGTTGSNNTAHGWFSLFSNTSGSSNTADGFQALYSNTGGGGSTANGAFALFSNTIGGGNTASGFRALFSNINGNGNTASGNQALLSNTTGNGNTATGAFALESNTEGNRNTATGGEALDLNTTGSENTATGLFALRRNTTGNNNTASGAEALFDNDTGSGNTAVGFQALAANTTRDDNTAVGVQALLNNTSTNNTAVGSHALRDNVNGANNTAIGIGALAGATGSGNVGLGDAAGANVTTANHVVCIASFGDDVSDSCYIGNIAFQPSDGVPVLIDANDKLGTPSSSERFKQDIRPMDKSSEALFAFKPVTFHYKKKIDPKGISQFGLVAEDVEKVNPDLVVRDKEGKPYSVRYDQVNAMLLNEFLKQHREVQNLKATITHQQNQIQALVTSLQKVNARIDTIPIPQLAAANP